MARRDGTGPLGMGPMTGRGFGPCGAGSFIRRLRPRLGFRRGIRYRRNYDRDYRRNLNKYNY
ncbi:DUF5320 domain-containing protein [Schnuerera sp.]|uniref:DUF5320 domain-containing protein n=1 Tax=Schnuerera sp. TaxID=2794844 RepID=UPI002C949486|nr:DUF5320 domain-containing protein [Schnuerera sp.]HSH36299.1 DUF5320 domain-containing protein [Schnuerera sp.]